MKILVADDEEAILLGISTMFESLFGQEPLIANDGAEAWAMIQSERPDLVVLDYNMPELTGLDVCRKIRADESLASCYVIILTAYDSDPDIAAGFRAGADDYITKPVSLTKLSLRVRAAIKRIEETKAVSENRQTLVISNDVVINTVSRLVTVAKEEVRLNPKEYDLLMMFVQNPGVVFSRAKIMELIWGEQRSNERTVDTHMRRLREKFEGCPSFLNRIKTIHHVGYRYDIENNEQ